MASFPLRCAGPFRHWGAASTATLCNPYTIMDSTLQENNSLIRQIVFLTPFPISLVSIPELGSTRNELRSNLFPTNHLGPQGPHYGRHRTEPRAASLVRHPSVGRTGPAGQAGSREGSTGPWNTAGPRRGSRICRESPLTPTAGLPCVRAATDPVGDDRAKPGYWSGMPPPERRLARAARRIPDGEPRREPPVPAVDRLPPARGRHPSGSRPMPATDHGPPVRRGLRRRPRSAEGRRPPGQGGRGCGARGGEAD